MYSYIIKCQPKLWLLKIIFRKLWGGVPRRKLGVLHLYFNFIGFRMLGLGGEGEV